MAIPLQCHFANNDGWCTPAAVDAFESAVKAAHKSVEFYRYDADHGFVNEQRPEAHNRVCAEQAWDRALAFWKKHIG